MAYTSGTGKGGKTFNDRELAARVRTKILENIESLLNGEDVDKNWSDYKKQVVLKMSANILPRLNEHTGEDGKAIEIKGVEISFKE